MAVARERAPRRRLDRAPARDDRSRPRVRRRSPIPDPTAAPPTCARPTRDGLLVSLIQTNFTAAGCGPPRRRVGHQPPEPRLVVPARRDASERLAGGEVADAHADSRRSRSATAGRGSCSARWAGTRRPRPISSSSPACCRRRRRPAGRDHRAALGGRSRPLARATSRTASTPSVDRRSAGARSRRPASAARYDDGMGHAHAIEVPQPGYRGRDRPAGRRRCRRALAMSPYAGPL